MDLMRSACWSQGAAVPGLALPVAALADVDFGASSNTDTLDATAIHMQKKLYDNDRLDVLSSLEPRGDHGPGSQNGPGLGERRRHCLKENRYT